MGTERQKFSSVEANSLNRAIGSAVRGKGQTRGADDLKSQAQKRTETQGHHTAHGAADRPLQDGF